MNGYNNAIMQSVRRAGDHGRDLQAALKCVDDLKHLRMPYAPKSRYHELAFLGDLARKRRAEELIRRCSDDLRVYGINPTRHALNILAGQLVVHRDPLDGLRAAVDIIEAEQQAKRISEALPERELVKRRRKM